MDQEHPESVSPKEGIEAPAQSRTPRVMIGVCIVFFAVVVCAAVYIRISAPTSSPEKGELKVAIMTWGGAGPGFVGIEKGFFGDLKVRLEIIDDSSARQAAYESSSFAVLLTNPDQHPIERQSGLPGRMLFLSDISNGADGLLVANDIESLSDLKGRQVVYVRGAASDYMLSKALESAGLERSDLLLKSVEDPSHSISALNRSGIAGAVSWEPLISQTVAAGEARLLFSSRDAPGSIVGVFVGKPEFFEEPDRLRQFVEGWIRSVEYVEQNREESILIMARAFSVKPEEMRTMLDGLILAGYDLNTEWLLPNDGTSKLSKLVKDASEHWRSLGLLDSSPTESTETVAAEVLPIIAQSSQ